MSTAVARPSNGDLMENVIAKGDLSRLTPQERTEYYLQVCRSVGLNPLTQPLQYITLNSKLTLYARRDAADQLRKIHSISIEIVSREVVDGLLTVHVRAKDASGRTDEDFGVVSLGTLKGEAAANAFLKAVTKAKRRVTLSISGLGFLDETEIEDIPMSAKRENPHVTRPVDIVPEIDYDEHGEPIDNIPLGDERIEQMTKAKSRSDYASAQHEMRLTKTPKELETWGKNNANRIASYPSDWAEIMRGMYAEHMADLRKEPDNVLMAG